MFLDRRSPVWLAVVIVAFATGVRISATIVSRNPAASLYSDMGNYDRLASSLLEHRLAPGDTFIPIGYSAFLAAIYGSVGRDLVVVGIIQAVFGGLTCLLVWLIAWNVTGSRLAALAALLVSSLYPPLIYYGSMLLTESIAPFFLTLAIWLLLGAARRPAIWRSALAGLSLSVATVIRPNFLLLCPFLGLFLWCHLRPGTMGLRVAAQVLACAIPLLALVSVNNSRLVGRPTGLSTNGGLNFFMMQADVRGVQTEDDASWGPIRNGQYRDDFRAPALSYDESYFYRQGIAAFLDRRDKARHTLTDVAEGFGLGLQAYWPANQLRAAVEDDLSSPLLRRILRWSSRAFFWLVVLPILIDGAITTARGRLLRPEGALTLLACSLVIVLAGTFAVFLADPRVHVPFDPVLIAFVPRAVTALVTRQ